MILKNGLVFTENAEFVPADVELAGGTIGDATTLAKIEAGVRNIRVTDLAAMQKIFSCAYEEFFQGL